MMRTIEEIKADIYKDNTFESAYALKVEFLETVTHGIKRDRLEEICQAERDGRLVDAQEFYNRLKVAEFEPIPTEIKDYAEGYNKAIKDVTMYMVFEYGVKPLTKEEAEKALEEMGKW